MDGNTPSYATAQFFYFWLWEYQRRNKKYVKGNAFAEDYNRKTGNIESPKKGLTSEYILKRALENKDIIEEKEDFFDYYYSDFAPSLDATGVKLTKEPDSNNKITAKIDISQPLESVLQGVRYYHKCFQVSSPIDEGRRQGESEKRVDGLSNLLKFFCKTNKPKKLILDDLPRARGLWMWDYIKENNLGGDSNGKVEAIKAYKRFLLKRECYTDEEIKIMLQDKIALEKTRVNLVDLEDKLVKARVRDITDKDLKRYITNTEKCIKELKVLKMTG
jgi:hypothetical protein